MAYEQLQFALTSSIALCGPHGTSRAAGRLILPHLIDRRLPLGLTSCPPLIHSRHLMYSVLTSVSRLSRTYSGLVSRLCSVILPCLYLGKKVNPCGFNCGPRPTRSQHLHACPVLHAIPFPGGHFRRGRGPDLITFRVSPSAAGRMTAESIHAVATQSQSLASSIQDVGQHHLSDEVWS